MIKGSTVIMSDEYIDELTRHLNNFKQQLANQDLPDQKVLLQERVNFFEKKLEEALDFQDTVDEIVNLEVPSMAVVKTMSGLVIPLPNIKVL